MTRRFIARARDVSRRFLGSRHANFAVMTALSAPFAIALAAFAVDQGSLFTERRGAQALTDLAAITAAANINEPEAAALATLKDNGLPGAFIARPGETIVPRAGQAIAVVTPGRYIADPSIAIADRFVPGKTPFNSARVSLHKVGTLFFGNAIMDPPLIGTTATAAASAQAAFSIGSRLLGVDTKDSALLNPLLGGLLGTSLSLDAMDYKALVSSDIDVLSFIDTLATQAHLTGVTYSDILASKASIGQVATAMANVPGLDRRSQVALKTIAASVSGTLQIPLSQLIDLGPIGGLALGQEPAGLSIATSALGMLTAGAALANGKHQVQLELGATVPGLTTTTIDIAIGEPEQASSWLAVGQTGTTVRTAQTRIRIVVGVDGLGGLLGKVLSLPIYVDIAYAEGRLADISCSTGRIESLKVKVDATPGFVDLRIADIDSAEMRDFRHKPVASPARLVDVSLLGLGLVSVSGQARAAMENPRATSLTFNYNDMVSQTARSTSTHKLTGSLAQSLLGSLQLEARLLGIKIAVPRSLTSGLSDTLNMATGPVDVLLDNLLDLLGVRVGETDIRVLGATCSRAVLVQ